MKVAAGCSVVVITAMTTALTIASCGGGRVPTPASHVDAGRERADGGAERHVAAALPLVPRPRSMTTREGTFAIDRATKIVIGSTPEMRRVGEQLARWLGLPLSSITIDALPSAPESGIVLQATPSPEGAMKREPSREPPRDLEDEAYVLDVSPKRALVRARSFAGLFYGAQSLAQLAGARRIGIVTPLLDAQARWSVPCVAIDDAPRFPFRGMHLDVARHFFSKEVVERYVDLLSFYRFNVFHWHLTDDQGFRFEVKGHPELTSIGGTDGSYTQADAREVIAHASERAITVMPEIEMPGHARAILAAHPELSCTGKKQEVPRTWGVFDDVLCAGNEKTYALLADVLGEVTTVFPSRLVHVGGDEVPPARWKACPKCRAAMKAHRVDVEGLGDVFMKRVASKLAALGRRVVVWDEAMPAAGSSAIAPDMLVLAWQSKDRGREAAASSLDVVMAPHDHVYFNTHQSAVKGEPGHDGLLPWTTVRVFDPLPERLEDGKRSHVLGAEGALWTEYITTRDDIDAMVMPRMAALAESLWSGPAESEADFVARFGAQLPALDASSVRYFVEPPTGLRDKKVFIDETTVRMAPPRLFPAGVVRWTSDGSEPTVSSRPFEAAVNVRETTSIAAALFLPGGRSSPVLRSTIVKERPRPAARPVAVDKGVHCTYVETDLDRLPDFAKVTAKARGRAPGIGLTEAQAALGAKMRSDRFALLFEGYVNVPARGVYRFVARADDGVRVEVDGATVLEDDGVHAPRESDGEIALDAGAHPIRVSYFQGTEGKALDLRIEGVALPLGALDLTVDRSVLK